MIVVPNMRVIDEVVSGANNDDGQKSGLEGHIVEGTILLIDARLLPMICCL